jgi:hypothetical protein
MLSSFSSRYRFNDQKPAVGVYRDVLDPPASKCDVTYWLNYLAQNQASRTVSIAAINTAGKQELSLLYTFLNNH